MSISIFLQTFVRVFSTCLVIAALLFSCGIVEAKESVSTQEKSSKKPYIVTSIKPLFGLVNAITKDVANVGLIKEGFQSGHTFLISPKQVEKIMSADFVVWAGPSYELMMLKTLHKLCPNNLITLQTLPGIKLLSKRTGALFPPCDHDHENSNLEGMHKDGHFWLDLTNAKVIVNYLSDFFMQKFPDDADKIAANTMSLLKELDTLENVLKQMFEPVKGFAALSDHDSLYYFEKNYGFNIRGILFSDDGVPLSPGHLNDLTQELDANIDEKIIKVFLYSKTMHKESLNVVEKLCSPYNISTKAIDYDGSFITCAEDDQHKLYQIIVMNLAQQIVDGLLHSPLNIPSPLVAKDIKSSSSVQNESVKN